MKRGYSKLLYGQRNKDETILSVIKRLFGEHITSRLVRTQNRELCLRCIAYNMHRLTNLVIILVVSTEPYIFQRHAYGGSSSTSISIDIQILIAELQKYGSIKSTIEQLGQEADKLRNEIASLKAQKQDILARLIFLRQIYQVYSGPLIY